MWITNIYWGGEVEYYAETMKKPSINAAVKFKQGADIVEKRW